ncbi:hemerythrin domain-containing protein [Kitasatospora sp. NPDC127116]|uniref:hemerythrin domain-containing protein n=1 Tax=Kitasatospora sp. NPDC127116 TaxID=3345367 RepID=UPI003635E0CE
MHYDEDLLEQLTADHRSVLVHFSELSGVPSGDLQRKDLADLVTDQLVRHTRAEEQHLYPIARDRLADGPAVVERELADHRAVEACWRNSARPTSPRPASTGWSPGWPRR